MRLIKILSSLRSYASYEFHPSHNPHYALVRGPTGKRRWHLIVPGSGIRGGERFVKERLDGVRYPVKVEPIPNSLKLGELLKREIRDPEFYALRRVPVWKVEFPGLGGYIIKPLEKDIFAHYPKAMTAAFEAVGAPHVTYAVEWGDVLSTKSLRNLLNTVEIDWAKKRAQEAIENNGVVISPFIEVDTEWPETHYKRDSHIPPEIRQYLRRLESRNKAVETLMGAPDRHQGNYLDYPVLAGLRNYYPMLTSIPVGYDYEWHLYSSKAPGILHALDGYFPPKQVLQNLSEAASAPQLVEGKNVKPEYKNPTTLGVLDVVDRLDNIPYALDKERLPYPLVDASEDLIKAWKRHSGPLRRLYEHWVEEGKP